MCARALWNGWLHAVSIWPVTPPSSLSALLRLIPLRNKCVCIYLVSFPPFFLLFLPKRYFCFSILFQLWHLIVIARPSLSLKHIQGFSSRRLYSIISCMCVCIPVRRFILFGCFLSFPEAMLFGEGWPFSGPLKAKSCYRPKVLFLFLFLYFHFLSLFRSFRFFYIHILYRPLFGSV